jgi:hypothetical protein
LREREYNVLEEHPPHLLDQRVSQTRNQEKQTGFSLGFLFDPEDGGNIFF